MGFRSNLGVVVVDTGGGGVVPLRVKGATARVCTCGAPGEGVGLHQWAVMKWG